MSITLKHPIIISASVFINALLFLLIHQLVTNEIVAFKQIENISWVDFIQLQQETQIEEVKKTEPDEPPPPEETPPIPTLAQPDIPKPQQQQIRMETPNINVPLSIDGVLYVGDYLKSSTGTAIGPSTPALPEIATNVVPTTRVEPVYPPRALRAGIEGSVTVEFTIDTSGAVKDIEVVNAEPPGVFEQAVQQAIRRWKFAPEIIDGKPVEKRARQDIKFSLKR